MKKEGFPPIIAFLGSDLGPFLFQGSTLSPRVFSALPSLVHEATEPKQGPCEHDDDNTDSYNEGQVATERRELRKSLRGQVARHGVCTCNVSARLEQLRQQDTTDGQNEHEPDDTEREIRNVAHKSMPLLEQAIAFRHE